MVRYTSEWQTERTILAPDFNAFYSLEYCVVYQIQIHTAKESESGKETTRKCQIPASTTQPVHFYLFIYLINRIFFFLFWIKYDQTVSLLRYLFIGIWHDTLFRFFTFPFPILKQYRFPLSSNIWFLSFDFKNHLGIHSFSSTCLVLFFTCLVGFLCFVIIDVFFFIEKSKSDQERSGCVVWRKKKAFVFKSIFWRKKERESIAVTLF